jgi:hypothetical protein
VCYSVQCSCTVAQRSQSCRWHTRVKNSGLKMVNEHSCGLRSSASVLFTQGQKSLEYDFTRVV